MSAVSEYSQVPDPARSGPVGRAEEARLVRACQAGSVEAFERIVDLFQDRVYGLACRLLHSPEEAEDIAQEVFLNCHRSIGSFRSDASLGTWLYRITVNLVKNRWKYHQRRQASRHESLEQEDADGEFRMLDPEDPAPGPREQVLGREIARALEGAIAQLTLEHREVVTLRFLQDLQYEEIAEVLDCSIGTVKSRINRARRQLREMLGDLLD